jgi:uncharacterized protein (TIGR02246 family)
MLRSAGLAIIGLIGLAMPVAAEDIHQAVEQNNSRMIEAFKAGDAAAIAALYGETAKVLPPDATEVVGREAIHQYWQGWIDDGLKDLTLDMTEVEASGDLAYEIGNFSVQVPAENDAMATATGNYVAVWKRGTDGAWLMQVDTWNDAPAK